MSNLTDDLVERSQGLLKIRSEPNDWTKKGYTCFDDGGIECEVGEFLYGLIRMIKPEKILTTGIYTGVSDSYMGLALLENGLGEIIALEQDKTHLDRANDLFNAIGFTNQIIPLNVSSLSFEPTGEFDFMFLDSEPEIRFKELVKFFPHLKEGGFVFIHDLPRGFCKDNINPDHPELKDWPFGPVPDKMKEWLKSGELVKWHFPTPRSLTGFYKSMKEDYKC